MQAIVTEKTAVGKLAAEYPAAARVFENLGIDYCCGGSKTLEEACREAGLPLDWLRNSLDSALSATARPAQERDWNTALLADLIAHIRSAHHQFTRTQIARLDSLFGQVFLVHGKSHPELAKMQATFGGLAQELSTHMIKEEMVLFPYIEHMEEAVLEQSPVLPAPFGTVRNPVAMMISEHDGAGEALREMRASSNGYTVPPDACASYRALYQALAEFEADLHHHIHLENNLLFPRAVEMQRESARRR
jgi:regulator of cell morphogenesis and NO signaling